MGIKNKIGSEGSLGWYEMANAPKDRLSERARKESDAEQSVLRQIPPSGVEGGYKKFCS